MGHRGGECLFWVETTHQPVAAFGRRTFNVGFPAVSPKSCRSPPDPEETYAVHAIQRQFSERSSRTEQWLAESSSAEADGDGLYDHCLLSAPKIAREGICPCCFFVTRRIWVAYEHTRR